MSDGTAGQRARRVVSFGQVQTGGIARGLSLPARPDASILSGAEELWPRPAPCGCAEIANSSSEASPRGS